MVKIWILALFGVHLPPPPRDTIDSPLIGSHEPGHSTKRRSAKNRWAVSHPLTSLELAHKPYHMFNWSFMAFFCHCRSCLPDQFWFLKNNKAAYEAIMSAMLHWSNRECLLIAMWPECPRSPNTIRFVIIEENFNNMLNSNFYNMKKAGLCPSQLLRLKLSS
jgi:hypothetical protein